MRVTSRSRRTGTRSGRKTSPDAALQLLGLATRAGAVVTGTQLVREAIRAGRVRYVLVAADLTETGRDKLLPMLGSRNVPHAVRYRRDELGAAVGRGPLAAVGVTEAGLAGRLEALLGDPGGAD